ncbi:MAG: hypothetical protein CVU18_04915 [Betaproteobacteria bacterium HGW-Betaproteobacteria-12]|nr:MAG: hypothetical protein CVU18_04915 [Betaproteobacteria bacterium HGW-Betaproteobacteria-12]
MSALREQWASLQNKYAALSRREKLLVAFALILAPLLVAETLIAEPQRKRLAKQESTLAQQSAAAADLQTQVLALQKQLQLDPDAGAKAELAALNKDQARLESELEKLDGTLVRPEQMNELLEHLLAGHAGLRLLSLKTLKPQSVLGKVEAAGDKGGQPGAAKTPEERFDLYRHGVEIRLEGSFVELQAYLAQLEQSPQRLLWGQLQYEVSEYPKAEMSLLVYTLSADRSWLAL